MLLGTEDRSRIHGRPTDLATGAAQGKGLALSSGCQKVDALDNVSPGPSLSPSLPFPTLTCHWALS